MSYNDLGGYFWTTPVTKALIVANVVVYVVELLLMRLGFDLDYLFGLHYVLSDVFTIYQPFTYMFLHANFSHIFFNMFALFMFGRIIEQLLGKWRFLTFYVVCGLSAALAQEVVWYVRMDDTLAQVMFANGIDGLTHDQLMQVYERFITIGASGSVFGLLLAFAVLLPNQPIFLFFIPVPIKAKYFVAVYALIELYSGVSPQMDNVAHFAHLGGMIGGALMLWQWRKNSY